jgi:hypothetical protein
MENYNVELTSQEVSLLLDAITTRLQRVDELLLTFNQLSHLDNYLNELYNKEKQQLLNIHKKIFNERYK